MKKILYIVSLTALVAALSSCRGDDDFTESIFNTDVQYVDATKATYKFDQWLYDNFMVPYNVDIRYRFDLSASDMNFQLTPADYERSQLLSYFIKYLFYDVYTKYAGDNFMKQYGPRIFHFIGSSGYSPTTNAEVLGRASGGVKITLYNINEMKPYSPSVTYNDDDIEILNDKFFNTMHHEFSHILHQTKSYPVTFGQVTSGSYDPIKWHDRDSVQSHQLGYVTHYASSAVYEDLVETLACIITDTDARWMNRIINSASMGVRQGDKEAILNLIDSLNIDVDQVGTHWNNFTLYEESKYNDLSGEYDPTDRYVLDVHRLLGDDNTHLYQVINKEHTDWVNLYKYKKFREFTSFKDDFLPWVKISTDDNVAGFNAMKKKIDIATNWHKESWGLYTFSLRREVSSRQAKLTDFVKDEVTIFPLQ